MSDSIYAVLAYIATYWFALLALIIIWRAMQWIRKDATRVQRQRSRLPDAGFIGEWVVIASDAQAMPEGLVISAPRDGWIGSARACDIRILSRDVPSRVARFYLRKDGLHILPRRAGFVEVDGEVVRREAVLRHGAALFVGGVTMQLRLFAGILLSGEMPMGKMPRKRANNVMEEAPEAARTELPKPALTMKIRRNRSTMRGTTYEE